MFKLYFEFDGSLKINEDPAYQENISKLYDGIKQKVYYNIYRPGSSDEFAIFSGPLFYTFGTDFLSNGGRALSDNDRDGLIRVDKIWPSNITFNRQPENQQPFSFSDWIYIQGLYTKYYDRPALELLAIGKVSKRSQSSEYYDQTPPPLLMRYTLLEFDGMNFLTGDRRIFRDITADMLAYYGGTDSSQFIDHCVLRLNEWRCLAPKIPDN